MVSMLSGFFGDLDDTSVKGVADVSIGDSSQAFGEIGTCFCDGEYGRQARCRAGYRLCPF